VILLVGLTELKAQIGWTDSITVSLPGTHSCSLSDFWDVWFQGVEKRCKILFPEPRVPKAESTLQGRGHRCIRKRFRLEQIKVVYCLSNRFLPVSVITIFVRVPIAAVPSVAQRPLREVR
jgi:hypothetical protein